MVLLENAGLWNVLLADAFLTIASKSVSCRSVTKRRELSICSVRGNARLFKKFVGVLARGIGQRCVEGMDVPVLE